MSWNNMDWTRFIILRDVPHELFLARSAELSPSDAMALTPASAVAAMEAWLRSGRFDGLTLSRVQALVEDERLGPSTPRPLDLTREELLTMLRTGRLRLYQRRLPAPVAPLSHEPEDDRPAAPAWEEKKTWVAIRLLDDDVPPKAVPFKRYRVELTDGSIREGMLDANGEAYFGGIDPGTCQVSFPDYDGADWKAV